MGETQVDIHFLPGLSITQVLLRTSNARDWWAENVQDDGSTHFGRSVVVENRYLDDILVGADGDGLLVEEL